MNKLARVLDLLEKTFSRVNPPKESAYEMLVRTNCGYPASDAACEKGWTALAARIGTKPDEILGATNDKLTRAMRAGGIVPALRAKRLKEIAKRVKDGADLSDRKTLKKFPTIADPGADKILLFTRVAPIAAVPSNALQVPVRIGFGKEGAYAASYRSAQKALDADLPKTFDARIRAFLLLKRHGQDICKRSKPRCDKCPLTRECDYFASSARR